MPSSGYGNKVNKMRAAIYYESKSGNNQKIAERLKELLTAKGYQMEVHRISDSDPRAVTPADLYIFSSPTRMGKPARSVRKFLNKVQLPPSAKYALIATHVVARPNKRTGVVPTEEESARWRKTLPIMTELLDGKGSKVAEEKVFVKDMQGPLEDDWEKKVEALVERIT